MTGWILQEIDRTTPARPVAVARIIVGCAALAKGAYLVATAWATIGPTTLHLPYVAWLPPVDRTTLGVLLAAWLVAAGLFTLGWRTRAAGAALAGVMTLVLLSDRQLYSNHLYLLVLLAVLLTIGRAGAALSLDSRRTGERTHVPAWPVTLMKVQLTIVYGFAAIAKLNAEFLSGGVIYLNWSGSGLISMPDSLARVEVMATLAVAAVLAEIFLALGFWSARLIRACVVAGVVLHLSMVVTVGRVFELLVFAALMASVYVLFWSDSERPRTPTLSPGAPRAAISG